jgi:hypothetical protein
MTREENKTSTETNVAPQSETQSSRTVLFFSLFHLKNLKSLSEVIDREASAEEVADLCEAWLIG